MKPTWAWHERWARMVGRFSEWNRLRVAENKNVGVRDSNLDVVHQRIAGTIARIVRGRMARFRRWYFEQMKLVLDRLASIPDGSGTLLDSTTILHLSEFGGPNANSTRGQHSNTNLPYMLVAGSQTPFRTGQSLSVSGRNHGDFLLTLARGFGSTATTMGVGTTVINDVLK